MKVATGKIRNMDLEKYTSEKDTGEGISETDNLTEKESIILIWRRMKLRENGTMDSSSDSIDI